MISEHFPKVSSIVIDVTNSYGEINPITVLRTFNFWPNSYAYFNIECLSKGCHDGGFDLHQVITMMIRSHKESGKGEIACEGTIFPLTIQKFTIKLMYVIPKNLKRTDKEEEILYVFRIKQRQ